ncbi:hypothetical protein AAZV13_19G052300 [Glycine max]
MLRLLFLLLRLLLPTQEVFVPLPTVATTLVSSIASIVASPSTIATPFLTAGSDDHKCSRNVASFFLKNVSPSSSSHPKVSQDHVYTSRDTNSMWSMGYRSE